MKSKTRKTWTRSDLKIFDSLVSMMDSRNQLERISGRLRYREWSKKFTKEQLEEMWQHIKDRKK